MGLFRDFYRTTVVSRRLASRHCDDPHIATAMDLTDDRRARKRVLVHLFGFFISMYDTFASLAKGVDLVSDDTWHRLIYSRLCVMSYKPVVPLNVGLTEFRSASAASLLSAAKEIVEKFLGRSWTDLSAEEQFARVCMHTLAMEYAQQGMGLDLGGSMSALAVKLVYPTFCCDVDDVRFAGNLPEELLVAPLSDN